MKLWWYSAGNIVYTIGSLGYLAINTINHIFPNTSNSQGSCIILIILASVFVLDAILYALDWFEQRRIKKLHGLVVCICNIIGSVLYLCGAITLNNKKAPVNNSLDLSNLPAFLFSTAGILVFLLESILNFFTPRVSKTTSKCSVEFFAHLLNLLGNITYLIAQFVQPAISFIASFTTSDFNKLTGLIYFIIRPIQMGGDIIYTVDALLYMIVWIKANQHMQKIGTLWVERAKPKTNDITKKTKPNVRTPELIDDHGQYRSNGLPIKTISKRISKPVVEDVEN
ncbi:unnamed protein product [Rotaria magnacalcarata]|uniref:Uncharacterized protein n=2 Tax=Rotaria magnacalcarata TaxID=392030 RepID=A0A816DU39_9BILA|nr:unnamed protein product [Rotaria magnacalcarata]CAF1643430.1 unnamed protein product [Rotaria magnacalcarata]CAF2145657.1 unnamed protein product [Rotaria magnacalcarata]CAF4474394.1 unnamed protein product [Rotaria magnacalcarata]CAF5082813.1 unnamed protein product [Rotaria magnacalcarata]